MKAPIYAYVVGEDNNFLKVVSRDASGVYRIFVARFLRGSRAEGGYSESSADMISDIKARHNARRPGRPSTGTTLKAYRLWHS